MYNNKYRIGMWTILAPCLVLALVLGSCRANDHNVTSVGIDEVTVTGNGPVLHVVGQKTATGSEGGTGPGEVHELWYDEQSGDTSYEVRDAQGHLIRKVVVNGLIIEEFNAASNSYSQVTAPNLDAPMRQVGDELLGYLRSVKTSDTANSPVMTPQAVMKDGQLVLEFGGEAVAEQMGLEEFSVQVNPTTSLPHLTQSMKNGVRSEVRWIYSVVERLGEIPDAAFTISQGREPKTEELYLDQANVRTFSEYPIYYLGETYDDFPIFARISRNFGNGKRWFHVTYAEAFVDGVQKRKGKVTIETHPFVVAGEGTPIIGSDGAVASIHGEVVERRKDIEQEGSGSPIELQIGASRVRLYSINEEDLSTAVASIKRLNDLAPTIDSGNR